MKISLSQWNGIASTSEHVVGGSKTTVHVHRSMINIPASHLYLFSLSALTFTMITLPCSGRLWRNVLLKGTRCTICVQRGEKSSRSFLIMMISSFWSCYSCCCCYYSNIVSLFTSQQHCLNFPALFCCYFSNVAIIEFHNRNIGWWSNWHQPALMWPISSFIKYGRMWAGGTSCQIWFWFVNPKRTLNFERTRGRTISTMTGLSLLPFLISAHCCSSCNGIHLSNQDVSIFVSTDPYMSIYINPISCATLTV